MDLLIAQIALDHDADLTTFDRDFEGLASICHLRLRLLERASH